jgi:predicted nucleic acid-binding protein
VKFLVDTCVLSELRHPTGSGLVKQAIERIPDENLFLSVITVGEIAKGIELLPQGKKQSALHSWLNSLQLDFADRIVSVDQDVCRVWGTITARLQLRGVVLPAVDGLIAATALRHGMHLITRNAKLFAATEVQLLDPWQS